jgi:hypothetical protein
MNNENDENHGKGGWIIGVILLTLFLFALMFVFVKVAGDQDSSAAISLLSREAKDSDISVETSQDISFGASFKITPKVDIKDLQITIVFSDKDYNELNTVIKTVGNVTKGTTYSVTVSINEIGWIASLGTSYSKVTVSGGTVAY